MAFWGTSTPKVELLNVSGAIVQTYNLPVPTSRQFGWPQENDNRSNPLTRELIERFWGYRPFLRLTYTGQIASLVEDLLEIADTQLMVRVTPHSDVPAINFIAIVSDFVPEHFDGMVELDSVMIEFTAQKLVGTIPNVDTLYTVSQTSSGRALPEVA